MTRINFLTTTVSNERREREREETSKKRSYDPLCILPQKLSGELGKPNDRPTVPKADTTSKSVLKRE